MTATITPIIRAGTLAEFWLRSAHFLGDNWGLLGHFVALDREIVEQLGDHAWSIDEDDRREVVLRDEAFEAYRQLAA